MIDDKLPSIIRLAAFNSFKPAFACASKPLLRDFLFVELVIIKINNFLVLSVGHLDASEIYRKSSGMRLLLLSNG